MARTETVTVVFTDLVGSTELASRLGHDAYEALRHEHFTALRAAVAKHGGTEVKTTGDGLMLAFASAADAVAGAVGMQQATNGAVQIRIGLSSGEATRDNNDLFGAPVVEASRLCAAASAGQILVSEVVRLMARGHGHSFTSIGELTLKGLPEPVAAYEVKWEPLEAVGLPLPPRLAMAQTVAMVGREAELAVIAGAYQVAKSGQRQIVLLAGEPGIGKTRLASEAALAAHADGATVLLGTCDEDTNPPYQPFVEALRHYVAHAPEAVLSAYVREHKGELTRLIPELGKRVADLPPPQVAEAETERYLLFEAVTGLLSAASQDAPIVLILDDLQWSRTPELVLLKHVLRSAMPLRLLIVVTYRDSDLTRAHPLTAVLADLRREAGVERIALHGLDERAVVALMTAAAGHGLTQAGLLLAHAIHEEAEGSPFFIGEILRNMSESGAIFQEGERWTYKGSVAGLGIPEGVKEVIGRRLSRLSEATNKVLSLAAVIGRHFDLALLTRIAEQPEDAVLDALDEATRAALVAEVPGSADQFSFSHALIRTTLYEELSAARRARLHRKVGEGLEELTGSTPETRIDELAHHWLAATQVADMAKAIGYARQAGDRALANLAFEEAAAHYERALSVLVPHDRAGEELRCDLLLALGDVQRRAGNPSYRETVAKAVDVARALGDGERLALAVLGHARLGGTVANTAVFDEGLQTLYEEASAALGEADSPLRARVLGQLAAELSYTGQRERRHALSREAVAIARRLGDLPGLGQVLSLRLHAIYDPFTLAERLDLTAELAALAARVGSSELAWQAAYHRGGALLESGDIVGAEQSFVESERLAGELRQPFYMQQARQGRAMLAVMRGAPDAEAEVFAAFELGMAAGVADAANAFGAQVYLLRSNQGRLAELVDILRGNSDAQPHMPAWRAVLARAYCETDQMEEARAQVDALRAGGFDYPPDQQWSAIAVALSQVVSDLQDSSAAAVVYERMRPIAKQAEAFAVNLNSQGSYGQFCGMLAACLGRWDDAERHFTDALEMNERFGARPYVVRTRRAWAAMLLDRNDPSRPGDAARARELIAAGRAEAEQLGMARELVRFDRLNERL
ncbi:MAG: AAA family ATPase [Deltaproteobacteria bacterium]|nr:AAA family ATPase [Deltaproteobacteria bacterium]MBI3389134.1 AAA family ATPase [Deltaproteobacteria bacterium]